MSSAASPSIGPLVPSKPRGTIVGSVLRAWALGFAALGLFACRSSAPKGTSGGPAPSSPTSSPPASASSAVAVEGAPRVSPEAEANAARAERQLALKLYAGLRASGAFGNGDAVFSPLSIAFGLAVAHDGARGATRDELGHALGFDSAGASTAASTAEALASLETAPLPLGFAAEAFRASRLTALWVAAPLQAKGPFEARAKRVFGAEVLGGGSVTDAVERVNAWARERSQGRLPSLLPSGAVPADTRLLVGTALDVSGRWLSPFAPERTAPRPFFALSGTRRLVPTMSAEGPRAYASTDAYEAVQLPLEDKEHAVLVVAPRRGAFSAFEASFGPAVLDDVVTSLRREHLALELPKVDTTSRFSCVDAVRAAGVRTAFLAGKADFGEMLDAPVVLAEILHGAAFTMDEHGVRGTAGTFMVFPPPSLPPKPRVVRIDRPFLHLLRNVRTGAVLFVGRYTGDS